MANLIDHVYSHSPVWVQQLGVAAYGWWWYRRRFGPEFRQQVRELKAREFWSAEQFRDLQGRLLAELLAAAEGSPYYRQVFREAGVAPGMDPWEALGRIPPLSKEVLRTRADDLLTQNPVPRGTMVQKSSGTTGTPSQIYYTRDFHAWELSVPEARNLNWAGATSRDRRVMFGVRKVCRFDQAQPPFWRFSPAEDMAYASIYHLSPAHMPAYLAFFRDYRPAIVMGYPSALATLARFALEHDDLPAPAKVVVTTSETVTDSARQAIEAAWSCRLVDRYGAVEGCLFASQCEHGRYHVSPEVGVIEILDAQGRPCLPGQLGEVICTGLRNTLQPLIRYQIGDVARWSAERDCACGRKMPVLEAIEGRYEDVCYTADGRQIVRFDTVFKGIDNIREAQVVQEALDRFAIRVVATDRFGPEDEARLRENMRVHVGDVEVDVVRVVAIERTASGKFRAVLCKLPSEARPALVG